MIDLRSDTVTKPTAEMRKAMAEAEVGDDVYLEDPTVNRLQDRVAEMFGREAALFVPSGTMGNQIAVKIHTEPGQEVITEERGHIYNYEMAAMAAISGVLARPVPGEDGILRWEQIEAAIRPKVYYRAQTGLISLENTHNMAGGSVYTKEQMDDICERAHGLGIPVHLDGARIFNAVTVLDIPVSRLTERCDSIMFCLSKGLCAPVGSLLVGSRGFIEKARAVRKLLGGGMRQAGVLAAAGLVALEKMTARLREDHENARLLAEKLSELPGLVVDPKKVRTNILIVDLAEGWDAPTLAARLKERDVLIGWVHPRQVRLVTHHDVSRNDCLRAIEIFRSVMYQ
ncbi:MAG: low-specificity L-threonine aldolase [Acidobacteria bacterium]|nr:low-specificity L-threonine aldolase [Acidobacteriota bacterium]